MEHLLVFIAVVLVLAWLHYREIKKLKFEFNRQKDEALKKQRSVVKGQISEHMFPLLNKEFELSDMRFLGQPIDYIVFDGYGEGDICRIVFVEIKTGGSSLSKSQQQIRKAVENGKVEWKTINIGNGEIDETNNLQG